jgi:hypothetical protein
MERKLAQPCGISRNSEPTIPQLRIQSDACTQALDVLARVNRLRIKVPNDPLKAWKQLLATLILSSEFTPGGGGHVRFIVEPGKSDQLAEARGLTAAGHKVRVRIMLHNEE